MFLITIPDIIHEHLFKKEGEANPIELNIVDTSLTNVSVTTGSIPGVEFYIDFEESAPDEATKLGTRLYGRPIPISSKTGKHNFEVVKVVLKESPVKKTGTLPLRTNNGKSLNNW